MRLPTQESSRETSPPAYRWPSAGAASVPPTPTPATVLTISPLVGSNVGLLGSLCGGRQHLRPGQLPSPNVLSFVVIGNPTNAFFGANALGIGEVWPQSPYQVIDVSAEYDGVSDFPNNPSSAYYWLAVANAEAGFFTVHLD